MFGCGWCSVRGWWETGSGLRRQKWVTDAKSLGSQTQNTARTPKKYRVITPKKYRVRTPKKYRVITPKKYRVITPKKYGVVHRFSYH